MNKTLKSLIFVAVISTCGSQFAEESTAAVVTPEVSTVEATSAVEVVTAAVEETGVIASPTRLEKVKGYAIAPFNFVESQLQKVASKVGVTGVVTLAVLTTYFAPTVVEKFNELLEEDELLA